MTGAFDKKKTAERMPRQASVPFFISGAFAREVRP